MSHTAHRPSDSNKRYSIATFPPLSPAMRDRTCAYEPVMDSSVKVMGDRGQGLSRLHPGLGNGGRRAERERGDKRHEPGESACAPHEDRRVPSDP